MENRVDHWVAFYNVFGASIEHVAVLDADPIAIEFIAELLAVSLDFVLAGREFITVFTEMRLRSHAPLIQFLTLKEGNDDHRATKSHQE